MWAKYYTVSRAISRYVCLVFVLNTQASIFEICKLLYFIFNQDSLEARPKLLSKEGDENLKIFEARVLFLWAVQRVSTFKLQLLSFSYTMGI